MSANSENTGNSASVQPIKSNRWMLCIAWMVVGVPLGWGVFKSVEKSLPLFRGQSATTQPPAPQPAR